MTERAIRVFPMTPTAQIQHALQRAAADLQAAAMNGQSDPLILRGLTALTEAVQGLVGLHLNPSAGQAHSGMAAVDGSEAPE